MVSRQSVLDEIQRANNAPASTIDRMVIEHDLEPALLHQALLAAFPSTNSCMLWTPEDWYKDCQLDRAFPFFVKDFPLKRRADSAAPSGSLADLVIRSGADFRLLKEKTCQYSYLHVHPPLSLKTKPTAPVRKKKSCCVFVKQLFGGAYLSCGDFLNDHGLPINLNRAISFHGR